MFCIAAFIILAIISVFSARYRKLMKKAWGCVARRVTLRPCDTSFKEDVKNKLLSKVALKTPRLVKAADVALEIAAVLIVLITLWSAYVVVKSGLNLYVYGTCSPANSASCSLGAEACSIETVKPSFVTSIKELEPHIWFSNEFKDLGKTITAIPTRMQTWKAEEYLPKNPTYLKTFDPQKPTALEAIDPGCQYCKELYINQEKSGFANRYNLTYIPYPIKDERQSNGYKFRHSLLISQYLEAIRLQPLKTANTPVDWLILDRIFTGQDDKKVNYQTKINGLLDEAQTRNLLRSWLAEFGYEAGQITVIEQTAASAQVADTIEQNSRMVEDRMKTVKIPTMIFDGKRHDGVLGVDQLD